MPAAKQSLDLEKSFQFVNKMRHLSRCEFFSQTLSTHRALHL